MKVSASYRFKRAECGLFNTCIYNYTAEVNLVGEGSTYHGKQDNPELSINEGTGMGSNNDSYSGIYYNSFTVRGRYAHVGS